MAKYSNFIHCQLEAGDILSNVLKKDFGIELSINDNYYDYIKKLGVVIVQPKIINLNESTPTKIMIKSIVDDTVSSLSYSENEYVIGLVGLLDFQNVKIIDLELISGDSCYIDLILTNTEYDMNSIDISQPVLPVFPISPPEIDTEGLIDGAIVGDYETIEDGIINTIIDNYSITKDGIVNTIIDDYSKIEDDITETEEDLSNEIQ